MQTILLTTGAAPDATLAALRKTTVKGWTLWSTAGAWTPPGPHSDLPGAPREEEAGTAVLVSSPLSGDALASILADLLGETSVGYVELPPMRFSA